MGLPCIVCSAEIDESLPEGRRDFKTLCKELARRKIEAVLERPEVRGRRWFIGADTVVVKNRRAFGKPRSKDEARSFIACLAGGRHRVITGLALYDRITRRFSLEAETARVKFAKMTEAEIDWYIETGEWQGAAGGYRIQERAACFIESIRGNYDTVVGLPIRTIYAMLKVNNYPLSGIKSSGG
jgi:septum formation protein